MDNKLIIMLGLIALLLLGIVMEKQLDVISEQLLEINSNIKSLSIQMLNEEDR